MNKCESERNSENEDKNDKPRQNGRKMTSFLGAMAKLGAGVDNKLGGSAPHQCRSADVVWMARCRDADREKGRASWCQVGLPAQSLPLLRFRRALRAFI